MTEAFDDYDLKRLIEIDSDPINRESDRGCVLICASDIENILQRVLLRWFEQQGEFSNAEKKRLFEYTGALGTFSSKFDVLKAMGLIGKEIHTDLHLLRKIRNHAAHSSEGFSLSDDNPKTLLD